MEHCGIDLPAKASEVAVVDERGVVSVRARIGTTEAALQRWFGGRATEEKFHENREPRRRRFRRELLSLLPIGLDE